MTTYNNIITKFQEFCANHMQINTFYSGQTWDFQSKTNVYPALIMVPQPGSMQQGMLVYNWNVFIMDILNSDGSNTDEILSDIALIFTDLVSTMKDDEDEYDFWLDDENITLDPFVEKLDDRVAGWMAPISIQVKYSGTSCGLPIK